MKFQHFLNFAFALAASLLLAACGGGGAGGNPNQGGSISASPENGTFYAGEPATITLSGGRRPYAITSSEPGILPVPPIVDANSFQVVPNNPGTVDIGLQPGQLPVRTVVVSVRDSTGILVNINIRVAQNFVTGYGLQFVASTCPAPTQADAPIQPCAGNDTAIQLAAVTNGSLHGNELFRLEVVRGQFAFYTPNSSTGIISSSYTTTSDHEGKLTAVIRVPAGVPSQIGIIRVVHVGTGASQEQVFVINSGSTGPILLVAIPQTFTFTGPDNTACGTGSGDFFVFDGVPPYTAVSSHSGVQVTPSVSNSQPGRFTVAVGSGSACPTAAPIVVTDSLGNRVTVTVTASRGPAPPAAPAATDVTVAPDTITLACGTSGSVSAVGGTPPYSVSSSHPRVTATASGNTVTISRMAGPDPAGPFPTTATVSVTDGASAATVTVNFTGLDPAGRCN